MPVEELDDTPLIEYTKKIDILKPDTKDKTIQLIDDNPELVKVLSKRCDVDKIPYGHMNSMLMHECEEYGEQFLIIVEGDKRKLFNVVAGDNVMVDTFKDDKDLNSFLVMTRDILQFAKRSKITWEIVDRVMKREQLGQQSDDKSG